VGQSERWGRAKDGQQECQHGGYNQPQRMMRTGSKMLWIKNSRHFCVLAHRVTVNNTGQGVPTRKYTLQIRSRDTEVGAAIR
jgi:hypothetical protein